MSTYRAGVIGCGRPSSAVDANKQGYSFAYAHGDAYQHHDSVIIAAVADISEVNARAYADHFQVPDTYLDYKEMIDRESLDIVSVCTWPTLHKDMVIYAARAGVKMIWCEKPMAVGVDEVDEMIRVCHEYGARLFINHQRRFEWPFQTARTMLDDGVLGPLEQLEGWVGSGWDLMSWGTHWVDMLRFFMHDEAVEWVVSSAPHEGGRRYGHPIEEHMLLQFGFKSGVIGAIHLGNHVQSNGLRIIGAEGSVSLNGGDKFIVQHIQRPAELKLHYVEGTRKINGMHAALKDIISAFEEKRPSEIGAESAAKTTEVIMAAYQASIERKKLSLPLKNRTFNLLRDYH